MTHPNNKNVTSPKMKNQSNLLAEHLLKGWRIHEVSGDYRSVLIIHNKTNEKKLIPFEGSSSPEKAFEKPYIQKVVETASIRSTTANSINTSQACQDSQFCNRDFVFHQNNDFTNNQNNNETHSTAATQGETEYLKNYFPQNNNNNVRRNTQFSVNSGKFSNSHSRISQTPQSLIVETGGVSNRNKERNTNNNYHQPLHAITSIGSTVINPQSQSTPIIHETVENTFVHHHRSHSGASKPNNSKDHDFKNENQDLRRISSPGLLVPNPVVRPNNRHSLDVQKWFKNDNYIYKFFIIYNSVSTISIRPRICKRRPISVRSCRSKSRRSCQSKGLGKKQQH